MSAIDDLATELARLPGIGRKTALRLTYHLLKQPSDQTRRLADALVVLGERVHPCVRCHNLTEQELCDICRDTRRDATIICAVEESSDIGAIERAGEFRGSYHVLGGRISPLDGVGPEDLRINDLVERVRANAVREVIVATNPTMPGEATALYLSKVIKPLGVSVTRIARGLPMGGDLEYTDAVTLGKALEGRREI